MVEKKEIDNKNVKVKTDKPVEEVKAIEDIKEMEDKKQHEIEKDEENDKSLGSSQKETRFESSGSRENKSSAGENIKNVTDTDKDEKKDDDKKKDEKSTKKKSEVSKKTEVVVNGNNLRISTKHAVAVCNLIKNKNIDQAIAELDEVGKMKRAIPMRGEIPHRKGIMSGRYPIKAVAEFIMLLKSLKSNAINHEIELEKVKLNCMANVASRPMRRFGQGKHKRSHVQIKLVPLEVKK
jgi:ribosomal protein L22